MGFVLFYGFRIAHKGADMLYVILAVLFVIVLFALIRVRGKRFNG